MSTLTFAHSIHLATDHAGLTHKQAVKSWLEEHNISVVDHGTDVLDESDDFPDFISKAAAAVSANPASCKGIIFGGSGQGEAMVANRYPHVRATVYYGGDDSIITLSRQHNDANILSIGARFVSIEETKRVVTLWLETAFDAQEKRERRNQKIEQLTRHL